MCAPLAALAFLGLGLLFSSKVPHFFLYSLKAGGCSLLGVGRGGEEERKSQNPEETGGAGGESGESRWSVEGSGVELITGSGISSRESRSLSGDLCTEPALGRARIWFVFYLEVLIYLFKKVVLMFIFD